MYNTLISHHVNHRFWDPQWTLIWPHLLSKTKRTFLPALDIIILQLIANVCDQKEHNVYAKNVYN